MKHNKRQTKKQITRRLDLIRQAGYFLNCNYHPVKLTSYGYYNKDVFGTDVEGIALTTGVSCSCSVYYCSPVPITDEKARNLVTMWKQGGDRALAIHEGGWTEESYSAFEKEWR